MRLDEPDLFLEPRMTGTDLRVVRLLVNAPRALFAALPLEVLHGVRHIDVAAVYRRFLEGPIEQPSRRPNEWMSGAVLLISWLLADDHDRRVRRPFAKDRLRTEGPQVATAARHGSRAELGKCRVRRNEIGRRTCGDGAVSRWPSGAGGDRFRRRAASFFVGSQVRSCHDDSMPVAVGAIAIRRRACV